MEEFPLVEEENPPDTPEPTEQSHVPLLFSMYPEHVMLQRSKGFLEQMKMRRTVRTFSDRHVPLEIIENVISVAGKGSSLSGDGGSVNRIAMPQYQKKGEKHPMLFQCWPSVEDCGSKQTQC